MDKLKKKINSRLDTIENKYQNFREGTDYTVVINEKGEKHYNIHSEELRKSVFGNLSKEGMIYPYFQEAVKEPHQIFPAKEDVLNTPF